jgi:hypothetical protein
MDGGGGTREPDVREWEMRSGRKGGLDDDADDGFVAVPDVSDDGDGDGDVDCVVVDDGPVVIEDTPNACCISCNRSSVRSLFAMVERPAMYASKS